MQPGDAMPQLAALSAAGPCSLPQILGPQFPRLVEPAHPCGWGEGPRGIQQRADDLLLLRLHRQQRSDRQAPILLPRLLVLGQVLRRTHARAQCSIARAVWGAETRAGAGGWPRGPDEALAPNPSESRRLVIAAQQGSLS